MPGFGAQRPEAVVATPATIAINRTTKRKVEALYSNDNWVKRRRVLYIKIYGQMIIAAIIVFVALWAAIWKSAVNNAILDTLLTIVVTALIAGASADVSFYVFGANADDKNKRDNLPSPEVGESVPPVDIDPALQGE